jgi:hypothetical protein
MNYINFSNQDEILRAQAREANDKFKRQRESRLNKPNQDEILRAQAREANDKFNLKKAPQPSQPQKGSKINLQRTAQQNLDKSARSQAYRKANKFRPLRKALTGKWARRGAIGVGLAGLGAGATAITMGALNRRKRGRRLQ